MVAAGDGVVLVQDRVQGPGDGLAVRDIHAALLVDVNPEEVVRALPHIFHIPQAAPVGGDHRLGKLGHLLRNLQRNHPFSLLNKKERGAPLSLPILLP